MKFLCLQSQPLVQKLRMDTNMSSNLFSFRETNNKLIELNYICIPIYIEDIYVCVCIRMHMKLNVQLLQSVKQSQRPVDQGFAILACQCYIAYYLLELSEML